MIELEKRLSGLVDHALVRELHGRAFGKRQPLLRRICDEFFGHGQTAVSRYVAEKLACLALSTWAYSVVVTFWFFVAATQSAHVFWTQMARW